MRLLNIHKLFWRILTFLVFEEEQSLQIDSAERDDFCCFSLLLNVNRLKEDGTLFFQGLKNITNIQLQPWLRPKNNVSIYSHSIHSMDFQRYGTLKAYKYQRFPPKFNGLPMV